MMEQPIPGSKLLASRTEKGMTQHELREKCHVSVRTIQRIESGAVTPRASTVKILPGALGDLFWNSLLDTHSFFCRRFLPAPILIVEIVLLSKADQLAKDGPL